MKTVMGTMTMVQTRNVSQSVACRVVMSQRTRWEIPRGRYDEHISKFSLGMNPKFNRPVGERNNL
jgi:hypothetical protein